MGLVEGLGYLPLHDNLVLAPQANITCQISNLTKLSSNGASGGFRVKPTTTPYDNGTFGTEN
eukprot:scaffold3873_cov173-Skeletonema_marinoi.AAC.2